MRNSPALGNQTIEKFKVIFSFVITKIITHENKFSNKIYPINLRKCAQRAS